MDSLYAKVGSSKRHLALVDTLRGTVCENSIAYNWLCLRTLYIILPSTAPLGSPTVCKLMLDNFRRQDYNLIGLSVEHVSNVRMSDWECCHRSLHLHEHLIDLSRNFFLISVNESDASSECITFYSLFYLHLRFPQLNSISRCGLSWWKYRVVQECPRDLRLLSAVPPTSWSHKNFPFSSLVWTRVPSVMWDVPSKSGRSVSDLARLVRETRQGVRVSIRQDQANTLFQSIKARYWICTRSIFNNDHKVRWPFSQLPRHWQWCSPILKNLSWRSFSGRNNKVHRR